MCQLFGYTEQEMYVLAPQELVAPEDSENQKRALAILSGGGSLVNHEAVRIRRDGIRLNVLISAVPIRWKGEMVIYGSIVDITPIKSMQKQLEEKNREILEFTNTVTHDLKKPLSTIKLVCSIMNNPALCKVQGDGTEALSLGKEAMEYMEEMLDDLLACARLEAGEHRFEPEIIDLAEVCATVLKQLKLQINQKHIKVVSTMAGTILADRKSVVKLLMNLIGNAVNYIGDNPAPCITLGAGKNPDTGLYDCTITDNGMGIPRGMLDEVFVKFKRGSNAAGIAGTGLGLTIAKGVVEMHGGKIWLQSGEGEGTTVFFSLPAATRDRGNG